MAQCSVLLPKLKFRQQQQKTYEKKKKEIELFLQGAISDKKYSLSEIFWPGLQKKVYIRNSYTSVLCLVGLLFIIQWVIYSVIFSDSSKMSNSEAGTNNFGEAKNGGNEGMDIEVNLQPEKIVEVFRFEVRKNKGKHK